jgi:predicted DNA-binding transcriptional regulator AlpA
MKKHRGPNTSSGQAHPNTSGPVTEAGRPSTRTVQHTVDLPTALLDVALIDGSTAASAGGMSLSWWHAEVAARRAPQPAIRAPRCTRWRLAEVRAYWTQRAADGTLTQTAAQVADKARKASTAAQAKRRAQSVQVRD